MFLFRNFLYFCILVLAVQLTSGCSSPGRTPAGGKSLKAETPHPFANLKYCQKPLKAVAKHHKSKNQWFRVADINADTKTFRTPTRKWGHWLELQINKITQTSEIYYITPQKKSIYSFSKKSCNSPSNTIAHGATTLKPSRWDDKYLSSLLNGQGVFYIWSPKMIYSMKHLTDFEKATEKQGLKFHAFMDPLVSKKLVLEAKKAFPIKKKHRRRLASVELEMRQFNLHFPTTYVFKNGKIHPERIIGVLPEPILKAHIQRRLREL